MEETIPKAAPYITDAEYETLKNNTIAIYGTAYDKINGEKILKEEVAKGVMVKYFNYYANTTDGKVLVAYYDAIENGGNGNGVIDTGDALDRNGDGVTNWYDNSWTERHYYYWFDNGNGGLKAVRDDQLATEGLNKEDAILLAEYGMENFVEINFTRLFLSPTFPTNGKANEMYTQYTQSEACDLYRVLNLAEEWGLEVFAYGSMLHSLSSRVTDVNVPGSGKIVDATNASAISYVSGVNDPSKVTGSTVFKTDADLDAFVYDYLSGLLMHDAFAGVSLKDEPSYYALPALGEVARSIKRVGENVGKDIYIMVNLFPYAYSVKNAAGGLGTPVENYYANWYSPSGEDNYADYEIYVRKYIEEVGQYIGYVQYDDYPFADANYAGPYNNTIRYYLRTHQLVSELASEAGIERAMAVQSYGNNGTNGWKRGPSAVDMAWQVNVSLAFGCSDISYYEYTPAPNGGVPDNFGEEFITLRDGTPNEERFNAVKDLNAQALYMSKALASFDYVDLRYYMSDAVAADPTQNYFFTGCDAYMNNKLMGGPAEGHGLVQGNVQYVDGVTMNFDGAILVTELVDDKGTADTSDDVKGYYVVNITDPLEERGGNVTVDFNSYKYVQVWSGTSYTNEYLGENGEFTISLGAGQGVFMIPYKAL